LLLGQRSNNIDSFDVNKTNINIYDLCRKYPEQVRVKHELNPYIYTQDGDIF